MTKVNEKQKRVIAYLKEQLELWEHTNDISSPTHGCEIQSYSGKLDDVLYNLEIAELEHIALCMYLFLRGLTGSDGVVYCT
jgi:hypothetical protein